LGVSVPLIEAVEHRQAFLESLMTLRQEVAYGIRVIFNTPDLETAQSYLDRAIEKYAVLAPKLADWMEMNISESFIVFSFAKEHKRRLLTANGLERLSQEIKRRILVVRVFPNEKSILRLISAVMTEMNEEYEFRRIYIEMKLALSLDP